MFDYVAIVSWIEKSVLPLQLVDSAYLFGSILRDKKVLSDVDVIIICNEWDVRDTCISFRKEFYLAFRIPLHIQVFHTSQGDEIIDFLCAARLFRRLL